MEQTKLALSAVMIVAVGLIGTNFVTYSELTGQEKFDAILDSNTIYGHITVVHSDPDGNVLSYIQTDNLIAKNGKDCIAELVFGDLLTECTASSNKEYNKIALFEDESFPITMNATGLDGGVIGAGNGLLDVDLTANGLEFTQGTVSVNANATNTVGSKTDITKIFTAGSGVSGQVVNGAALFNDSEDAVLAGQTFTAVSLNTADTLTITWTITVT